MGGPTGEDCFTGGPLYGRTATWEDQQGRTAPREDCHEGGLLHGRTAMREDCSTGGPRGQQGLFGTRSCKVSPENCPGCGNSSLLCPWSVSWGGADGRVGMVHLSGFPRAPGPMGDMCAYLHTHRCTHTYMYTYRHIHIYVYLHTCIYLYTHVHIYTRTYTHTHRSRLIFGNWLRWWWGLARL